MDRVDAYLRKRLQNWAAGCQPPAEGKARLLRRATRQASLGEQEVPAFQRIIQTGRLHKPFQERSTKFFDWSIVYSFEISLVNLRLML